MFRPWSEAGVPGFVATLLTGIVAPAGTPGPIVGKLNGAINATPEDRRDDGDGRGQVRITTAHRLAARVRDVPRRRDAKMG